MAGRLLVGDAAHSQLWIEDGTGTLPILLGSTLSGNSGVAAAYAGKDVLIDGTKSAGLGPTTVTESAGSRTNLGKTGLNHAKSAPSPSLTKKNAAGGQKPATPTASSTPDAAAATQVIVANIQPDYPQQIVLALAAGFGVSLLLALSWKIGAQRAALSRASESTHALRALAVAVQRLTRDASYDAEVPVQGDPEVAPLAIGFNAMLAELSQRDKARRDAESRLQHWALIDDLTGLPNRRLLSDRLSQSLTKAERDQNMVALLFMDLDGFKLVNDSMGHATGDALLAEVAQRLRDRFRLSDTIARIGGDEFALVLERIQERSDVQKAAEDLQELLKAPFYVNGQGIQTSACIGISLYPDSNERGQLLQQADCAMYAAKRSGRGRIVQFSDQLGSAARERLTMEGELQHAIAKGEISVLYQPEYDLLTNTIVRFEALARWTHPGLGKIMPMSFIPVAEENGQIIPLGMFVMERACNEAMAWQDIAQRPVQVAVNVSTVQFGRDSFFEEVADVLHRTGLHPSLLQIELTESATVAGVERAAEMMRRLKRMGVSVAVDDFGTGYSCLSYLPKLSFDAV
jgi:diguanylate cyclase (GGDEF)-like protein